MTKKQNGPVLRQQSQALSESSLELNNRTQIVSQSFFFMRAPCEMVPPLETITHVIRGEPISLNMTWITLKGKETVRSDRLFAGKYYAKVSVIRLNSNECVTSGFNIAEVIQTTLSFQHEHQPVWAPVSTRNMSALIVPDGIKNLSIAVDSGLARSKGLAELLKRLYSVGLKIFLALVVYGHPDDHLEMRHG